MAPAQHILDTWYRISLPFPLEILPDEHLFGGLVVNGAHLSDGRMTDLWVDSEFVGHIGIRQIWATKKGHAENAVRIKEMIADGRFKGVDPEQVGKNPHKDPYVSLTITLLEPSEQEMEWFWFGDGEYDGYGASVSPTAGVESTAFTTPIPEG